eukprot:s4100_g2.t2
MYPDMLSHSRWAVRADAVLPRSKTPARARRPKEAPQPWEHTLRPGAEVRFQEESTRGTKFGRLTWSRDFASLTLTPLHDEVIKLDVVLQGKEHSRRYRNWFQMRQAAQHRWAEKEAQKLHGTRLWQTDCPKWVWKPLPAKVVRLDFRGPTNKKASDHRRQAGCKAKDLAAALRYSSESAGSEADLTGEPEKAAGFVTKYGDLLVSEKVLRADKSSFKPWREEAQIVAKRKTFLEKTMCPIQRDLLTKQQMKVLLAREKRGPAEETWQKCLLVKLRRWRKGMLHARSCLATDIPEDFFLHRLETSDDFLSKILGRKWNALLYTITKQGFNFTSNHAYTGQRLLFLRKPWGNDKRWNGRWCDGDEAWARHPGLRQRLRPEFRSDGAFWMAWVDFQACFDFVYVCAKRMRDEPAAKEHARRSEVAEVPAAPLPRPPRRRIAMAWPERLPKLPGGSRVELMGYPSQPELSGRRFEVVGLDEDAGM